MKEDRSNIEDQILVMEAQDGDAEAMEKLVIRWQRRLWCHAFRLTGDKDAAWDVMQQSWLAIIKGLHKLNDPASFKAWAYRITTNKSIDWVKKNKSAMRVDLEEIPSCGPEEKTGIDVRELLGRLDIKKRSALNLYYFEQLSIPEISMVLNISQGTVKSRLFKARQELKQLWEKYFDN